MLSWLSSDDQEVPPLHAQPLPRSTFHAAAAVFIMDRIAREAKRAPDEVEDDQD